ncbi:MAG: prepilin peptidase [Acidimicrobiales bacterium]|nr:prepilin peptidase [Acidimicrobiales bacterium]
MPLEAALCTALGVLLAPLVSIIVDRAVEREPLVAELRCPRCSRTLARRALVPVFGLGERCSEGHRHWRYPAVTSAMAATYAVAGYRFGFTWQLWPYLVLFAALVAMSIIDIETKLLVNIITYPTLAGFLFAVLALSSPNGYSDGIAPALWAGGLYFLFFLVVHVVYPAGMGLGDVKLAPSLGLGVGWLFTETTAAVERMMVAVILGLLLGGVIGIIVQRSRKAEVPFGPFMVLGTIIVIAGTVPASL